MFTRFLWILPIVVGVYIVLSSDCLVSIEKYLTKCLDDFTQLINEDNYQEQLKENSDGIGENIHVDINNEERIWTREELEKYNNLENGLYLAILGNVFDVTKGVKHYGPGETYHLFTGRDGSLAFITGDFSENGMNDDISTLTPQQIKALNSWVDFYKKSYSYKGKLVGNFYNSDGSPAAGFHYLEAKLKQVEENESAEAEKNRIFPPCNVEWKAETGSRVWCTTSSGGIHRDWIGVPRMYFENPSSKQHRCACVNLKSREYRENNANFREFIECPRDSSSCRIILEN